MHFFIPFFMLKILDLNLDYFYLNKIIIKIMFSIKKIILKKILLSIKILLFASDPN